MSTGDLDKSDVSPCRVCITFDDIGVSPQMGIGAVCPPKILVQNLLLSGELDAPASLKSQFPSLCSIFHHILGEPNHGSHGTIELLQTFEGFGQFRVSLSLRNTIYPTLK